ncbi:hypothetical protein HALLA_20090 (plasmid) [Halostagnicola larsenii XH-48]|uniref:IclR family transcriptional regulator n=1 Tax=Halostagnicola larsenii XH-48 TaxID=797299 RepID=W0JYX5_9EURY|nr:helix-turn-helix domain-containing protein [Halostagnicola larsenii]AHG02203.1 hypothetical protein HALLA_20090 [Halostagnicola larsenii XH-48]
MTDESYTINATETSFEILELVRREGPLTTTQIATEIGLAKSAVHKHLQTLTNLQYLTRTEYEYSLGLRCFTLGIAAREVKRLFEPATTEVDNLAKVTGEHVSTIVVEGDTGYYIYSRTGENQHSKTERDGKTIDPYQTAAGHAIIKRDPSMEYLPETRTPSRTKITHEQGLTFSVEAGKTGQNSIAIPVLDPDDKPLGALEVTGPARRVNGKRLKEDFAGLLISAGSSIETQLQT